MFEQINTVDTENALTGINVEKAFFISHAVKGLAQCLLWLFNTLLKPEQLKLSTYLQWNLIKFSAPALSGFNNAEQHVGVHRALMGLVQDDHSVAQQQRISNGLTQQHAVCHELQLCLRGGDILETHCVTNLCKEFYCITIHSSVRLLYISSHTYNPSMHVKGNVIVNYYVPRL